MVVSLLKKFKNIISAVFLCISMFSLGISNISVRALKTDEIVKGMEEKMHEIESSEDENKDEKCLFIRRVLNEYHDFCVRFNENENKNNSSLCLDEQKCDSSKYLLLIKFLRGEYGKYDIASLDGFLKELNDFIDGLGDIVFERSKEEKSVDDNIRMFCGYKVSYV